MDRYLRISGGTIAILIACAVLIVITLPAFFLPAEIQKDYYFTGGYEASWYLLKATLRPLLPVLPVVFVIGLLAGGFFIVGGRQNRLVAFLFLKLFYSAQLPSAFFVAIFVALTGQFGHLDFSVILPILYCLVLLPRFTAACAVSFYPQRKGLYEAGLAFGASEFRSLVQLVWPAALAPLLAQLIRQGAILSLEVSPVVLLSMFFPGDAAGKPVGGEFYLQSLKLSSMGLVTFILTILAYSLLAYGISHSLKGKSELKIPGEYDAR